MSLSEEIWPYKRRNEPKKEQVTLMFNNIAHHYDFLNHFLSLGIDKLWRKKAINELKSDKQEIILDVATGTADLAIEALKLNPIKIIGIDISPEMLKIGRRKISKKEVFNIELQIGDSENLKFSDNTFSAITVAFGVRNFENFSSGLCEMYRVLKPGGKVVILEFSKPKVFLFKQLYNLYLNYILPFCGRFFSRDSSAYSYLPESMNNFPDRNNFLN